MSKKEIDRLQAALRALADTLSGEATLDRARLFLEIARRNLGNERVYQSDMATVFPNKATLSRNISALSTFGLNADGGLGLIRQDIDLENKNRRVLRLERSGDALLKKVLAAFG